MDEQNRRDFIRSSAACGSAALVGAATQATLVQEKPNQIPGYNYRLPKLKKGSTLLFQGDSITDMKWGRNQKDRNHYLGHSYVFLIAARIHTEMPGSQLNFLNRGISGNTVANLKDRWEQDALELTPDVLSILIGVNDVGRAVRSKTEVDVNAFERDYRSLLETSLESNPQLRIVLLEPFVLPVTRVKTGWDAWSGQINRVRPIVAKLAADYKTAFVKTQDVFDEAAKFSKPNHWIWDGVHPLPQGHELIARSWIETVAMAWG